MNPIHPWKRAWQTLKAIWPQLVYISLVCMSIPQYLLFYFSSRRAFDLGQAFEIKQAISFENALGVLQDFAFHYISVGWLVCVLFLLGCFTAVALCLQVARSEPRSLNAALKSGAQGLFPKGLAFLFGGLLLSLLLLNISIQIFPGSIVRFLAMVSGVLLSALPTLMVLDRQKPMNAFKNALFLDYVSFTGMSKWSVFFLLLTFQLLAFNAVALLEWLNSYILEIDVHLHISRELLFQPSAAFPFGKWVWLTEGIFSLGLAFITMAFVVLNTSFVYELYRRNSLGRTISVAA
ncbi:MAG: hypothetical protein H7318_01920 [Oligoflexus sp.]|nr:hypothetical protein [Oligoflexus sp.]